MQFRHILSIAIALPLLVCANLSSAQSEAFRQAKAAYDAQDYSAAARLVRPLAEAGDSDAQELLANMYASGRGVYQNSAKAEMWRTRSAYGTSASAQHTEDNEDPSKQELEFKAETSPDPIALKLVDISELIVDSCRTCINVYLEKEKKGPYRIKRITRGSFPPPITGYEILKIAPDGRFSPMVYKKIDDASKLSSLSITCATDWTGYEKEEKYQCSQSNFWKVAVGSTALATTFGTVITLGINTMVGVTLVQKNIDTKEVSKAVSESNISKCLPKMIGIEEDYSLDIEHVQVPTIPENVVNQSDLTVTIVAPAAIRSDEDESKFYMISDGPHLFCGDAKDPTIARLIGKKQKGGDLLTLVKSAVTRGIDQYLNVPKIPEPSLPPTPTLVKGEFEKSSDFLRRLAIELAKRDSQVDAIQQRYRLEVEERNKLVEERIQHKDKYADELALNALSTAMGTVIVENARYDAEAEVMYMDLSSTRSAFTRQIAVPVPLANGEAMALKESISNIRPTARFKAGRNGVTMEDVTLSLNGKLYAAQLREATFKAPVVAYTPSDVRSSLSLYQNPGLIDKQQDTVMTYAEKLSKGSFSYVDDLHSKVEQMQASPINGSQWLFAIAVEGYQNADKVVFAKNSGEILVQALQKKLGISERNTYALIDKAATAGAISDQLELMLRNVKPGDSVYFYYSGHGVPDPASQEPYLLPQDRVVDFIAKDEQFRLSNLYRRLSDSPAGHITAFIDSCFSGRTDNVSNFKGVAPGIFRTKEVEINPERMVVLTAGKSTQFSNAYEEKGHRLFTYYLVNSLIKPRSTPLDINTLYQEVSVGVRDTSSAKGDAYLQEPQIYGKLDSPL